MSGSKNYGTFTQWNTIHQKTILREGYQATEWDKIFTSYINDKGPVFTIFFFTNSQSLI